MDLALNDKKILVTGSSKGIGRAIAQQFLEEGASVMITGRNSQAVEQTSQEFTEQYGEGKVLTYVGDLTKTVNIKECLDQITQTWGSLSGLVVNIGSGKSKNFVDADQAEWDRVLKLNLLGSVELTQQALPLIKKSKNGSIVFISSIAGLASIGAPLPYAVAKSGLIAFAKGLSEDLSRDNIRVNVVAPGNIKFPGGRWEQIITDDPAVEDIVLDQVALNRFGTPQEIANVVAFLASDRASFVTGACWVADGGQLKTILS